MTPSAAISLWLGLLFIKVRNFCLKLMGVSVGVVCAVLDEPEFSAASADPDVAVLFESVEESWLSKVLFSLSTKDFLLWDILTTGLAAEGNLSAVCKACATVSARRVLRLLLAESSLLSPDSRLDSKSAERPAARRR